MPVKHLCELISNNAAVSGLMQFVTLCWKWKLNRVFLLAGCFPIQFALSVFLFVFLQGQAHKTVLEISLPVPLLISPLHEGKNNHRYLLDLQLNKSSSKGRREPRQKHIFSASIQLLECIYAFENSINGVFILNHFSTRYHVIVYFYYNPQSLPQSRQVTSC